METIEGQIEEQRKTILDADWPVPRKQVVIADLATDQFIGTTNWNWEGKEANWRSVGIGIYDPHHWGKGLGFEALGLWTAMITIHPISSCAIMSEVARQVVQDFCPSSFDHSFASFANIHRLLGQDSQCLLDRIVIYRPRLACSERLVLL